MQKKQQIIEQCKVTYYFSYFECFEEHHLQLFFDYHYFIERLIIQLGQDWRIQSNLLWEEYHQAKQNQGYSNIFNIFLQVFLKDRINNQFKDDQRPENQQIQQYHQKVVKRFCRNKAAKVTDQQQSDIGKTLTFKTLTLGFYVTAADICSSIFKSVYQIQSIYKFEIKPLIKSYETKLQESIVKKRKNSHQSTQSMRVGIQSLQILSYDESMKSNIKKQKEGIIGNFSGKRNRIEREESNENSIIWRKFEEQDRLPQIIEEKIKQIFEKNIRCEKWQQISNFLINIFQVTYEIEGKVKDVRIIRICRQFYHSVVLSWMLLNTKKNYSMTYKQYEDYIKYILQDKWKLNYSNTLKMIYNIVVKQWNQLIKESAVNLNQDFQVMKIFISRIRNTLHKEWSTKILDINLENI